MVVVMTAGSSKRTVVSANSAVTVDDMAVPDVATSVCSVAVTSVTMTVT